MSSIRNTRAVWPICAVLMLWGKTELVYWAEFHLEAGSLLQTCVLLINPVAFLLTVFGLSFLFKEEKKQIRFCLAAGVVLSVVLYANILFFRFFSDYLTLPVLFQTSNFSDLKESAMTEIKWQDVFYFSDCALYAGTVLLIKKTGIRERFRLRHVRAYWLAAGGLLIFNTGLAEIIRPQLFTRTFDREMLVKNIGPYGYELYDLFLQSRAAAQKAMAGGSGLEEVRLYTKRRFAGPDPAFYGIAKGRNVIVVSLESTQNFVLGAKIGGQEITPFLNRLAKDSYFFSEIYPQIGQGKTSDAEFLAENALYPLGRGAVFFTHPNNTFHTMAKRLNSLGYDTAVFHANQKSFWNRDKMYQSFGYRRFYAAPDYEIRDENSAGWGLKDIPFFIQSAAYMEKLHQPFYAKLITLTNHHPFILGPKDMLIPAFTSKDPVLNRYFTTVRYEDEALKRFFQKLRRAGLYDRSVIVLYGDHPGISRHHKRAMEMYLGKKITPPDAVALQKVPLIIHIPGITDKAGGKTIAKTGGQADIRPTVLHLLGADTREDIQFGQDLLSTGHEDFAALRDGSFVNRDLIWNGNRCYRKNSGDETEKSNCRQGMEQAARELKLSDKLIYGDLLRFSR